MQIIRHKTVKIAVGVPLALAVTAGFGLTCQAAVAATRTTASDTAPRSTWTPTRNTALAQLMADAAAPSLAVGETGGGATFPGAARLLVTTGDPGPGGLTDALLATGDLPRGYVPVPDALKAFADTGSQIGACDKKPDQPSALNRPVASGAPEGPGLPVHPSPRIAVTPPPGPQANPTGPQANPTGTRTSPAAPRTTPTTPPTGPRTNPATPPTGPRADPTGPLVDPTPPPGHPNPQAGGQGDTVRVAYMKGETGPVLIEALNPAGDRAAADVVAAVAEAPRRCPTYDEGRPGTPDALHMATYPLTVPRFGNRTAGVRFEVDLNSPRVTVHGKMIAVSVRGVALTVLLANLEQPDQRELVAITRTAVQKLNRRR
ncbi:hypothetical protein [Actinoplanes sp. HUAS TT8]|uniref:hypothetical protein n=1 Tax=Actinoplanes sp. HUAS TT8 TaxID=3447453 RepID=UPI003F51DAC8